MLESPRVKIIIDTLQSNGEYDVFSKKYGPIADDAILILNKLRSLPEETFSAPYGQEKLQVLIKGFSQTNQQINKVAEQTLNVSDNFQLEKYPPVLAWLS